LQEITIDPIVQLLSKHYYRRS